MVQATAVWTSEEPPAYHRPSLLHDLWMHLRRSSEKVSLRNCSFLNIFRRHLFFKTGMPELRTNPLAGESEKGESGVVVEYFSQEMGFVKLDSEDGLVVLFHLNQVIMITLNMPSPSPLSDMGGKGEADGAAEGGAGGAPPQPPTSRLPRHARPSQAPRSQCLRFQVGSLPILWGP